MASFKKTCNVGIKVKTVSCIEELYSSLTFAYYPCFTF